MQTPVLLLLVMGWAWCLPFLGILSAAHPGVFGEGREPRGCLDEDMRVGHPLEPHLRVFYPSAGSQPWGKIFLRGNMSLGIPQLGSRAGMGNKTHRGFYLPLSVSVCVEIEDLYLPLRAGGHGQSLNQRSLMFWFVVVFFSPKSTADSSG